MNPKVVLGIFERKRKYGGKGVVGAPKEHQGREEDMVSNA